MSYSIGPLFVVSMVVLAVMVSWVMFYWVAKKESQMVGCRSHHFPSEEEATNTGEYRIREDNGRWLVERKVRYSCQHDGCDAFRTETVKVSARRYRSFAREALIAYLEEENEDE